MGSCRYYARIYANNALVRTVGVSRTDFYQKIEEVFPHIYKLAPELHQPDATRDPTMIMMWKYYRHSGKRELLWIMRGFEKFEPYKPTTIFVPMSPLYFEDGAHRDQTHCFMKLLKKKYKLVSYDAFKQIFYPKKK